MHIDGMTDQYCVESPRAKKEWRFRCGYSDGSSLHPGNEPAVNFLDAAAKLARLVLA